MSEQQDLVTRLRLRAEIRRQIPTRKSVQEGRPDRIADLLDEAALEIERLHERLEDNYYFDAQGNRISCEPGSIPDGIECRDQLIRHLEQEIQQLKSRSITEENI